MNRFCAVSAVALGLFALACSDSDEEPSPEPAPTQTVLELRDVAANPDSYEWFEFRPNLMKLILAGAAETEHIAILWYTVEDGAVGLHYHSKTESVYVIDGAQTDGKGTYSTGTVYFNPPGSGHEVSNSTGFFLLAYAAPPDFMSTDLIEEYEPVSIDTMDEEMMSEHPFEEAQAGVRTFSPSLVEDGGISASFIETTSSEDFTFTGNYVLVLEGNCLIDGVTRAESTAVVEKELEPIPFVVTAPAEDRCFALGVSF